MSYQSKTIIRAHREPMFRDRIHLNYYRVTNRDGVQEVQRATLPTLETINENEAISFTPTFSLHMDEAQQFMDELWSCGLRPTEGSGSAGAMAAVQAHLKDMQRLVFDGRVTMETISPPDQR